MKYTLLILTTLLLTALHAAERPTDAKGKPSSGVPGENLAVSDSHLLLDSRVVAEAQNARLTLGSVEKHAANPLMAEDKPWEVRFDNLYANVLYDPADRLFKCWYSPFIVDLSSNRWRIRLGRLLSFRLRSDQTRREIAHLWRGAARGELRMTYVCCGEDSPGASSLIAEPIPNRSSPPSASPAEPVAGTDRGAAVICPGSMRKFLTYTITKTIASDVVQSLDTAGDSFQNIHPFLIAHAASQVPPFKHRLSALPARWRMSSRWQSQ